MCLLGHRREGDPLAVLAVLLTGVPAQGKVRGYAHAEFPWGRDKYCGSLCAVAESKAFQHPVEDIMLSLDLR